MSPVDQGGAVAIVARSGVLGRVLLAVATVCLVTFAVWQVRAGTVGFRWVEGRGLRRRKRIGAFAKTLGVGGVAYLAVRVLVSGPGDGSDLRVVTTELFALPGGRLLVLVAAIVVLITAISTAFTGVRDLPRRPPPREAHPAPAPPRPLLGAAGNLTRAVVFAGVGVLALGAVLDDAPDEVAGLDVALRTVAEHTLGTTALAIASLGFAAYGLYCLVDDYARHP